MSEIITIPLTQLILLLAAFFAPSGASEFEIHDSDAITSYSREGSMWISKSEEGNAFTFSARKFLSSSGLIEFSEDIDSVYQHNWAEQSVLRIGSDIEVLKTSTGLLIFPKGIEETSNSIEVVYTTPSRTVIPTRTVTLP